jgi:endo-1,4-beta-xylanase
MGVPLLAALTLIVMACPNIGPEDPPFVAVTGITGVPKVGTAGQNLTLKGTVEPENAANQGILWTVKNAGDTGAEISEDTLTTTEAGNVTVRATITNGKAIGTDYTQDFPIIINYGFVAVTGITGVPKVWTAGQNLILKGTVEPENAANQDILWTVRNAGTTEAEIIGDILTTAEAGNVTVRATITDGRATGTDYTQDFPIIINDGFVAVTNIKSMPSEWFGGQDLILSGVVEPENATNQDILWTVFSARTTGAKINGNTLTTTGAGLVTVRATIADGKAPGTDYTQDFEINCNVMPVISITMDDVPTTWWAGYTLPLSGRVSPETATYQTIQWTVADEGDTGARIYGDNLTATGSGTVKVRATIIDGKAPGMPYTQDFPITINNFVVVTGITGVPGAGTAGQNLILSGVVEPEDAAYQTIQWTVSEPGTTGAHINEDTLITTGGGTVRVTATIINGNGLGTDYTQTFPITLNFVPVSGITSIPAEKAVGQDLILAGIVSPADAVNKDILWTVIDAGDTGAYIGGDSGNTLITIRPGNVTVRATITNGTAPGTDYTQDFPITINIVPVTRITGISPKAWLEQDYLPLSGTVEPENATNKTIQWTVSESGTTGARISEDTLITTGVGTAMVRATIVNGRAIGTDYTQDFPINITAGLVRVTRITDLPSEGPSHSNITLSGTVEPENATNKPITQWNVVDARWQGWQFMTLSGNTLNSVSQNVRIRATIANGLGIGIDYTQEFTINVH